MLPACGRASGGPLRPPLRLGSEGPSPPETLKRCHWPSEICHHCLHFHILCVSPDREKVTQMNSDSVPFVTGSRGWQVCRPSGDRGAGGSHGQCQVLVRLAAIPEASSARQPPRASLCPSLWAVRTAELRGPPSGLKHSHLGPARLPDLDVPASWAPRALPRDPRAASPRPQRSPARPGSPPLPRSTCSSPAAQRPLQPSGTTVLGLRLVHSPAPFSHLLRKCLFPPPSPSRSHPSLKYLFAFCSVQSQQGLRDPRALGGWTAQKPGAGRAAARPILCSG